MRGAKGKNLSLSISRPLKPRLKLVAENELVGLLVMLYKLGFALVYKNAFMRETTLLKNHAQKQNVFQQEHRDQRT